MPAFSLDPRLAADCYLLAEMELSQLLLMNNALLPWYILVPRVDCDELHQLAPEQQKRLFEEINQISQFIKTDQSVEKLNTAAIGNIVRQMHIHILGRNSSDPWWPGTVWGTTQRRAYKQTELDEIKRRLSLQLPKTITILQPIAKA
ncbi:MAG: HIT family protein [Candidatus Thiodiazotropha taylori]|nr:HIT family protein [Candidatus Thiodiazotropha taylori]MCG8027847.1 HIT family protein [Candidatus Thiodiazotropha taylori]MCG8082813.1 HIT family protein [Candidatus Thiodiazotropha taylori]MCG8099213.1 HIT family protein [Candidatus Thiodiazotropha taylori]MCG8108325.1 HIT family protein [Candidatus Thiodiazotropha taylori]